MRKYHQECEFKREKEKNRLEIFFMEFLCWRRQKRKSKFCTDVHCKYCSDCESKNAVDLMPRHIFIEFSDKRSGRTLEIFLEKSYETNGMKRIHFYHIHSLESPVCYLVSLLCSTKTFPKTSLISFRDFRAIFVSRFFFFSYTWNLISSQNPFGKLFGQQQQQKRQRIARIKLRWMR